MCWRRSLGPSWPQSIEAGDNKHDAHGRSFCDPSRIFYMSVEFASLYSEASGGVINACRVRRTNSICEVKRPTILAFCFSYRHKIHTR